MVAKRKSDRHERKVARRKLMRNLTAPIRGGYKMASRKNK